MKKIVMSLLGAVTLVVAVLFGSAAPAQAGSDNGTRNWYSQEKVYASGGNLEVTNYDVRIQGTTWQEYHIDADRAGGVGGTPKVYIKQSGTSTWRLLSYWNDFKVQIINEWLFYDFKVVFSSGSWAVIGSI